MVPSTRGADLAGDPHQRDRIHEGVGNRRNEEIRGVSRGERDKIDTVQVCSDLPLRNLKRQTGFADPTHAHQRQKSASRIGQEASDLVQFVFAANK